MTPQEREVMQMALDALEHGLPIIEDFGGKEQLQLQHKAIAVLYEALRAALAQPEQEPVAYNINGATVHIKPPVYGAAPPQREWVGLTDEEKLTIVRETDNPVDALAATEAKLKEKNHE